MKRLILLLFLVPCGAFAQIGTQVVTDDFNRANQTPISGNWSDGGGVTMVLASNTAQPAGFGAADGHAIWNTWASGNDQYSQAAITAVGTSAGSGMGLCVRHSSTASTQTMYRLVMDGGGNIELDKFVTGTNSLLASRSVTYVSGTKLGLAITGNTMTIWYGGVQQGASFTDSSSPITTGVPGIAYSSAITSGTIDNWDAGTTGGVAAEVNYSTRNFFLTK